MRYYSSGKILLTSEYMVLKGARALALPTNYGQHLNVSESTSPNIEWVSKDSNGHIWFEGSFDLNTLAALKSSSRNVSERLTKWLRYIQTQRPNLIQTSLRFETVLEFDRNWGLGSSSSLVGNLAKWSNLNPIELLHAGMKGSGYDVAVGMENKSILYQIDAEGPHWEKVNWNPPFMAEYQFVYLGKKAKSEGHVIDFSKLSVSEHSLNTFNQITDDVLKAEDSKTVGELLEKHEVALSAILNRPTIKNELFKDYPHTIKSLGAWGGDFVLAKGTDSEMDYFRARGYQTILSWSEMIKTIS